MAATARPAEHIAGTAVSQWRGSAMEFLTGNAGA